MIFQEPRELLRIVGIAVLTLGMVCVPIGFGANPKRDTSSYFSNLADSGQFLHVAVVLIIAGAVMAAISYTSLPMRRSRRLKHPRTTD